MDYTKKGPDDNLTLNMSKAKTVSIPKGYRGEFDFAKEAAWEQAVCIYYENSNNELEQVAEKGTYQPLRDMTHWDTPYNHSERDKEYVVSGWYKNGGSWNQSDSMIKNRTDGKTSIGFNDGGNDTDYNDIESIYSLHHE